MGATPYEIMRAIPFDLPPKEFNPSEATEDASSLGVLANVRDGCCAPT